MRPSSSSDTNAPYRAAIASLGDCNVFQDQPDEQFDTTNSTHQHSPFAELSPRFASSSRDLNAIADTGLSSASNVTFGTIRNYLREKGHQCNELTKTTFKNRLNSANISAETLLTALKFAYDFNHPLLATLNVNSYERSELINRLVVIASFQHGFHNKIKAAFQNANDDPEQLIVNITHYLRNLKR